jgi:hypothetical protein
MWAFSSSSYTARVKSAATASCLVKRRLTMDLSVFQASCHNIVQVGQEVYCHLVSMETKHKLLSAQQDCVQKVQSSVKSQCPELNSE